MDNLLGDRPDRWMTNEKVDGAKKETNLRNGDDHICMPWQNKKEKYFDREKKKYSMMS